MVRITMSSTAVRAAVADGGFAIARPPQHTRTSSTCYRIVATLVAVVFLSGFINLIPTGGFYPATVLIDGLYALMLGAFIVSIVRDRTAGRLPAWVAMFVVLMLVYVSLFPNGSESLYNKYLDLRSSVLYAFVAIFIVNTLRTREEALRLLNLAMRFSVLMAAFGVAQFAFRDILPQWLLVSRDTTLFGYYGTDISRSTGLLGNTIVFSTLLLIFFTLYVGKLVAKFRTRDLAAALVLLAAIILTFSRVAIVGAGVIALATIVVVATRRSRINAAIMGFVALLFATLTLLVVLVSGSLQTQITGSFIFRDLFMGGNASVQTSTAIHNRYIDEAWRVLGESPWVGIGIASQRRGSLNAEDSLVITDGAIWSTLVEGGLVLFTAYAIFLTTCVAAGFKSWRKARTANYAAAGFLMFSTYELGVASVFNSAFLGKPPFIMYWVVFGVVVALGRASEAQHDKQPAAGLTDRSTAHEAKAVGLANLASLGTSPKPAVAANQSPLMSGDSVR